MVLWLLNAHDSSMQLDDLPGDVQAKAHAAEVGLAASLMKTGED